MSRKILLIDDDRDDRELFSEALTAVDPNTDFNYTEDAEAGLNYLANMATNFPDIIFLDINLPIMSGWQLLKQLKANDRFKGINVIMYSTSSNSRDKEIAKDLGAICFITKPSDYNLLKNMLQNIVTSFGNETDFSNTCRDIENLQ